MTTPKPSLVICTDCHHVSPHTGDVETCLLSRVERDRRVCCLTADHRPVPSLNAPAPPWCPARQGVVIYQADVLSIVRKKNEQ